MDGNYSLTLGSREVGKVQVTREGLYYRFLCRCRLPGDVISKVTVTCADKQVSLGVLVPVAGGFGLETKLPAKRLGEGEPVFTVVPNRVTAEEKFVPIKPEEPFSYIERLKDAYLARQNGELGAMIKEEAGI